MRTSTCLTLFILPAVSSLAHAGHGGVASSTSHAASSSTSHASASASAASASSSAASSSHGGSWGGHSGTVRDHRSGGGGGSRPTSDGNGSGGITVNGGDGNGRGPTVRDHRGGGVVGGGGGGGSSSADSGYAYDCCSTYDAVGYRDAPYGAWGRGPELPHVALELATGMRTFGDPMIASLAGKASSDRAVTTQLRFLVHMSGPLYLGAEGELGGLVSQVPTWDPTMMANSAMVMGGAGLIGAMSRQGNAAFGVELAAGGRAVVYQFEGLDEPATASIGTAVLEPRARAQYWVTPFVALGAQAGANVLSHGDWMAGGFLSIHTRAFGSD